MLFNDPHKLCFIKQTHVHWSFITTFLLISLLADIGHTNNLNPMFWRQNVDTGTFLSHWSCCVWDCTKSCLWHSTCAVIGQDNLECIQKITWSPATMAPNRCSRQHFRLSFRCSLSWKHSAEDYTHTHQHKHTHKHTKTQTGIFIRSASEIYTQLLFKYTTTKQN